MITLGTKGDVTMLMPQSIGELPDWSGRAELFLDIETKRVWDHKDYGGMYPWKGDEICGIAVTVDNEKVAYYLPIRHDKQEHNLPVGDTLAWIGNLLKTCKHWINHNILFDAVFCWAEGLDFGGKLVDTLTLSKIHDTDRLGHGLKDLRIDWLGEMAQEELAVKAYLKSVGQKSYSAVPAFMLGRYATGDVISNRNLYRYLQKHREDGVEDIWRREIELTPVLFDMEINGIQVDKQELMREKAFTLYKLINLGQRIAELSERDFVNSNACMHDILIIRFGMPVLATIWEKDERTGRQYDTGRPTFDKEAMALYSVHPMALHNPKLKELIELIQEYKEEAQYLSLFVESCLSFVDENQRIHPTYNQLVRTSRMSCGRPNAQQQNKRSKKLWKPKPGYGYLSCDYSQIEFRLIVHFIKDQDAINAYLTDPDTDFHQWVANMIRIGRKPAKTLNFGMGYGAGKKRVQSELSANPDIIKEVSERVVRMLSETQRLLSTGYTSDTQLTKELVADFKELVAVDDKGITYLELVTEDNRNQVYNHLCQERASQVWEAYHEALPGIRITADEVEKRCRTRGFVKNPFGRRRHIPDKATHKAFNSLVQGTAMDIIKERMVALSPRYNQQMAEWGISIVANVHDEVLFEVPMHLLHDKHVHDYILSMLETCSIKFRVPITTGIGVSATNWAEACGDETIINPEGQIVAGKLSGIKELVIKHPDGKCEKLDKSSHEFTHLMTVIKQSPIAR